MPDDIDLYLQQHVDPLYNSRSGSMRAWLVEQFYFNEACPRAQKRTDADIVEEMFALWPQAWMTVSLVDPSSNETLNQHRQRFNRGAMWKHGVPPVVYSFAYNEKGQAIYARTGRRLTQSEIRDIKRRHEQHREEKYQQLRENFLRELKASSDRGEAIKRASGRGRSKRKAKK